MNAFEAHRANWLLLFQAEKDRLTEEALDELASQTVVMTNEGGS